MNEEKIIREEEKLYEKLLFKIEDRSSKEYKRIYRKLYYIRNRALIKEYQKNYYRQRKHGTIEFPPPTTTAPKDSFKIAHKPIVIHFE